MSAYSTNQLDWPTTQQHQLTPSVLYSRPMLQQPSPISSSASSSSLSSTCSDEKAANDLWFEKFLAASNNELDSAATTNTTTSPLQFSSLFDVDGNCDDRESLLSSNNTSIHTSPLIKPEDALLDIPELAITNGTDGSIEDNSSGNGTATNAPKKPKKKRAPRKRLTAHQKQAHNKIEKRYRININAKIAGLQQIIPWVASEKTAFEIGDGVKPDDDNAPKLNKSMILEKATSYILFLQQHQKLMKDSNEKLRKEIVRLGGDPEGVC